jgi:hypothetical protein
MKKLKLETHDVLYISGSFLVVLGCSLHSLATGLVLGGIFLLFAPVLEIVSGFIRGLKQ